MVFCPNKKVKLPSRFWSLHHVQDQHDSSTEFIEFCQLTARNGSPSLLSKQLRIKLAKLKLNISSTENLTKKIRFEDFLPAQFTSVSYLTTLLKIFDQAIICNGCDEDVKSIYSCSNGHRAYNNSWHSPKCRGIFIPKHPSLHRCSPCSEIEKALNRNSSVVRFRLKTLTSARHWLIRQ